MLTDEQRENRAEERAEYLRQYRCDHQKQHRAYMRIWRAKNPERSKEINRKSDERRRAKKAAARVGEALPAEQDQA